MVAMTTAGFYAAKLSALMATVPGRDSGDIERADWYERQADLLELAAADGATNAGDAAELAATARRRAAGLRTGAPS
jgi:hypothetical protein